MKYKNKKDDIFKKIFLTDAKLSGGKTLSTHLQVELKKKLIYGRKQETNTKRKGNVDTSETAK